MSSSAQDLASDGSRTALSRRRTWRGGCQRSDRVNSLAQGVFGVLTCISRQRKASVVRTDPQLLRLAGPPPVPVSLAPGKSGNCTSPLVLLFPGLQEVSLCGALPVGDCKIPLSGPWGGPRTSLALRDRRWNRSAAEAF
ncbi:unnamed protein product [Diplocarpon coronariae]|nr:hypothetical protein JHW43_004543 [Diplocarpon mali]